jgi:hypothetical protein
MSLAQEHQEHIANLARGKELQQACDQVAGIVPGHVKGSSGAVATLSIYHCVRAGLLQLNPLGSHKGRGWISSTLS